MTHFLAAVVLKTTLSILLDGGDILPEQAGKSLIVRWLVLLIFSHAVEMARLQMICRYAQYNNI